MTTWGSTLALVLAVGCKPVGPPSEPLPPPPASVRLVAQPADAQIAVGELPPSVGTWTSEALPPGTYAVTATRPGFTPVELTLSVSPGALHEQALVLEPMVLPVVIETEPVGAVVTLTREGEPPQTGTTPFSAELATGPLQLELSLSGYQSVTESWFHEDLDHRAIWLDKEGQLLDLLRVVPTGPLPKQVAISPDNREVWVSALDGPPSVVVHDLSTGAILEEITLGVNGAVEVVFSPDGTRVYASQMETATVHEIDVATRTVLRVLDTESKWSKVVEFSADGTSIFVSNWVGNDISEISLQTGELTRRIPTVEVPRGLFATSDGRWLYAAGFEHGELARIDLATGASEVVWTSGANLRHIVGDEARGVLYLSDLGADSVWVVEIGSHQGRRLARTDDHTNTIDLTADGEVLLVSCRGRNGPGGYLTVGGEYGSVQAFDTRTGELLDAIVAGNQPTALDVSEDGSLLVFSDFRDDRIQVWGIPKTEVLRAGGGGRGAVYREELVKVGAP